MVCAGAPRTLRQAPGVKFTESWRLILDSITMCVECYERVLAATHLISPESLKIFCIGPNSTDLSFRLLMPYKVCKH